MIKKVIFFFFLIIFSSKGQQLKKIDNGGNVRLEADKITLLRKNSNVVLEGNVFVEKTDIQLFADKMIVLYTNLNEKQSIEKIDGYGNIKLISQGIIITSEKCLYDFKNNEIIFIDNVVLKEENSVVYGNKLIYNTLTRDSQVIGNSNSKNKRVKIIIDDINKMQDKYGK